MLDDEDAIDKINKSKKRTNCTVNLISRAETSNLELFYGKKISNSRKLKVPALSMQILRGTPAVHRSRSTRVSPLGTAWSKR